jgi:hypothetical protein
MCCSENRGLIENGDKNHMLELKSTGLLKEWSLQFFESRSFTVAADYKNEALAAESPRSQ